MNIPVIRKFFSFIAALSLILISFNVHAVKKAKCDGQDYRCCKEKGTSNNFWFEGKKCPGKSEFKLGDKRIYEGSKNCILETQIISSNKKLSDICKPGN